MLLKSLSASTLILLANPLPARRHRVQIVPGAALLLPAAPHRLSLAPHPWCLRQTFAVRSWLRR